MSKVIKSTLHSILSLLGWLKLRTLRKPTLVILTYHRVLPVDSSFREREQPGMIASPETLACHLELFQSLGAEFVHLDDWIDRKRQQKSLPPLAVAVTFDDGWRDNYTFAYPVLKQFQVPATVFLVSQYLNTHRVFWPEQVLEYATMAPSARPTALNDWLAPFAKHTSFSERSLTVEEADAIIGQLKSQDDQAILEKLEQFSGISETRTEDSTRQILNSQELSEMHASGLIRFGAHTRQHFRLNRLSDSQLLSDEIVLCKDELQALDVGDISLFCYPNGDITAVGEQIVGDNYQGACTTQTGLNDSHTSEFSLKRFNFHDGNGQSRTLCLSTIGRSLITS